jgi:hypothetical protein
LNTFVQEKDQTNLFVITGIVQFLDKTTQMVMSSFCQYRLRSLPKQFRGIDTGQSNSSTSRSGASITVSQDKSPTSGGNFSAEIFIHPYESETPNYTQE